MGGGFPAALSAQFSDVSNVHRTFALSRNLLPVIYINVPYIFSLLKYCPGRQSVTSPGYHKLGNAYSGFAWLEALPFTLTALLLYSERSEQEPTSCACPHRFHCQRIYYRTRSQRQVICQTQTLIILKVLLEKYPWKGE